MVDEHPKFPPSSRRALSIWPLLIALVVAIGIIVVSLYYIPRTPAGTASPSAAESLPQPTPGQLQVKDVKIVPSPASSGSSTANVRLEGDLFNAGQTTVNEVEVEGIFFDPQGRMVHSETEPLSVRVPQGSSFKEAAFAEAPLARARTAPFTVTFTAVPDSWNKQPPQLRIIHVGEK